MPIDRIVTNGEMATVLRPTELHGRLLEPGMIAAQRNTITGMHKGQELLRFRANWYCDTELDADWDVREVGWRIQLEGEAPIDIAITNPVSKDMLADVAPNKTPFRIVNAVPYVCQAAPGIRSTTDLPNIVPNLGALIEISFFAFLNSVTTTRL